MTTNANNEGMAKKLYGTTIAIVTYGHVWVAKEVSFDGDYYYFTAARIITQWGTQNGLNQLINGPTKQTVLSDIAPLTVNLPAALIGMIPCDDAKWAMHL